METTHVNLQATFRRLPDAPKLCHSGVMDCDILFDTGAAADIIPTPILEQLLESDFHVEDTDNIRVYTFSDGSSQQFDTPKWLTLPLSPWFWYRSLFCVGTVNQQQRPHLVIGLPLLQKHVLSYTRDTVNILDTCPAAYSVRVPLEKDYEKYYVTFKVNGRPHRFYLDTGHADAITLPDSESAYAISPIHDVEDTLYINGRASKVIDREEERGLVEIGGLTRHGPIIYADYYCQPCWFNPALIIAEFAIDLGHCCLCFKEK